MCCYQPRYFSSSNKLRTKKKLPVTLFWLMFSPLIRWTPSKYNPLRWAGISAVLSVLIYLSSEREALVHNKTTTTKPHSHPPPPPVNHLRPFIWSKQTGSMANDEAIYKTTKLPHSPPPPPPQLLRSQVPNRFLLPALHTLRLTLADSIDLIQ